MELHSLKLDISSLYFSARDSTFWNMGDRQKAVSEAIFRLC